MWRHNLKLTFRNFWKDKSTFLINLTGLSTGLACAILIGLWISNELSFDHFFLNKDRLYQVLENQEWNGETVTTPFTPGLLGDALIEELPEVDYKAEMTPTKPYILSTGENYLKRKGSFVGADFFNVFSYSLAFGEKDQVLGEKNKIVISENLANNFFEDKNEAIGKTLEWQSGDNKKQLTISGVFKTLPFNASHQFDFLLSLDLYKEMYANDFDWGNRILFNYLVLKEGTNYSQLNEKLTKLLGRYEEGAESNLFLKKYADSYLYGKYENGIQVGGRIEYVRLFSTVLVFILLIACFNFINLSTARADKRRKEIGVKKAIGAVRKNIIIQYLGEAFILTFLSLLVAIVLVYLALPSFNAITDKQLILSFDKSLVLSALLLVVGIGFLAGSYPAMYLSRFRPVDIWKNKLSKSMGALWVRKGLVIFQFVISILLIVGVLVVHQQITFVQSKPLGYKKENVIYFSPEGKVSENSETFLKEIRKLPGVVKAARSNRLMVGTAQSTSAIAWPGKTDDIQFEAVYTNYDLIETLGMEMSTGRSFSPEYGNESKNIIFNETAIKAMGLKDPIGQRIQLWEPENYLTIIGVVKDFHFESLHENIKPVFFEFYPDDNFIMAKIAQGKEQSTIAALENFHESYNPGYVFDFKFLDDEFQTQYVAESRIAILSRYFSALAILISCLGLFGLMAFSAQRRRKEIGIRKVLGASNFSVVRLLGKEFSNMVLTAIVIALPLSYYLALNWLSDFVFKIDLEWWLFVGAGVAALLIAWLTVGLQTLQTARINPVESLKSE